MATLAVQRVAAREQERQHFGDQPAEPTTGNLFEPMADTVTASGALTVRDNGSISDANTLTMTNRRAATEWASPRPSVVGATPMSG